MQKVLIAESDNNIAEYLKVFLQEKGFETYITNSGTECLQKVNEKIPDIVLISSNLEDIYINDLCKEIKKEYEDIPVIFMLESAKEHEVRKYFAAGADDFITKPINLKRLFVRITARLTRKNFGNKLLKTSDITMDTSKVLVTRGEERLNLSPYEYKLLKFLMINKGKVLSRDLILSRVWAYESDIESRSVDVYIGYLRKKIDSRRKNKLIKTVRGFGYVFRD